MLTTFDDETVLLEGVRAGISGFLLKDVSAEEWVKALEVVAEGGTVKNQASSILSKLGVRDRTRAVLKALEKGWLVGGGEVRESNEAG